MKDNYKFYVRIINNDEVVEQRILFSEFLEINNEDAEEIILKCEPIISKRLTTVIYEEFSSGYWIIARLD